MTFSPPISTTVSEEIDLFLTAKANIRNVTKSLVIREYLLKGINLEKQQNEYSGEKK